MRFRAGGYTTSEFPSGSVPMIPRGRIANVPLLADFSPEILHFTDTGRIMGELVIRYSFLSRRRESVRAVTVATHSRNRITPGGAYRIRFPQLAGRRWLPVEITVLDQGFARAWRIGALQWARYGDKAAAPSAQGMGIVPFSNRPRIRRPTAGDAGMGRDYPGDAEPVGDYRSIKKENGNCHFHPQPA